MSNKKYILCGIRIIHFANSSNQESNPFIDKKHELVLANYDNENPEYWALTGYTTHGMCPSGYRTASWGHLEKKKLEVPGSMHYIPKTLLELEWDFDHQPCYADNEIFDFLEEGCNYYPHGRFDLQGSLEEDYRNTGRLPPKPMLHIFHGASALGKSALAEMTGKTCHESDAKFDLENFFDDLPDSLEDHIIVLGNKHKDMSQWEQLHKIKEKYEEAYTLVFVCFSKG
mgnify:CR=1 FL=1